MALGNSGDEGALEALAEVQPDDTIHDPIVSEHVEWAKRKLTASGP